MPGIIINYSQECLIDDVLQVCPKIFQPDFGYSRTTVSPPTETITRIFFGLKVTILMSFSVKSRMWKEYPMI